MAKRVPPQSPIPTFTTPLKHNPFAGLASTLGPAVARPPVESSSGAPTQPTNARRSGPPAPAPPAPAAESRSPPPRASSPWRLTIRRETKGRAGKTVTRVTGIPHAHVDDVLHRIKRALGCGAVVEEGALVLLGDLEKRADEWLKNLDSAAPAGPSPSATTPVPTGAGRTSPAATPLPAPAADARTGTERSRIHAGQRVAVVQKADQPTGTLTEGVVREILTNSSTHPHGIKVRLVSGEVGRVKRLLE